MVTNQTVTDMAGCVETMMFGATLMTDTGQKEWMARIKHTYITKSNEVIINSVSLIMYWLIAWQVWWLIDSPDSQSLKKYAYIITKISLPHHHFVILSCIENWLRHNVYFETVFV